MAFQVKAEISGMKQLVKKLEAIDSKLRKKAVKNAVSQGGKILLDEVKNRVPVATGQLRKSLGRKVKVYRHTGRVVAIVGPRVGFRIPLGVRTKGKNAGGVYYGNPTQYAHLVEKGTVRSKATPFMSGAIEAKKLAIENAMVNVLSNAIEDAAK